MLRMFAWLRAKRIVAEDSKIYQRTWEKMIKHEEEAFLQLQELVDRITEQGRKRVEFAGTLAGFALQGGFHCSSYLSQNGSRKGLDLQWLVSS